MIITISFSNGVKVNMMIPIQYLTNTLLISLLGNLEMDFVLIAKTIMQEGVICHVV